MHRYPIYLFIIDLLFLSLIIIIIIIIIIICIIIIIIHSPWIFIAHTV